MGSEPDENDDLTKKVEVGLSDLPDVPIEWIVYHLDSLSLNRLFKMNRIFHKCILRNLSQLQPMYANAVTLELSEAAVMGACIEPIAILKNLNAPIFHLFGNIFNLGNTRNDRKAERLIFAAHHLREDTTGKLYELYGAKLKFEYFKNHHDTFLFMHPNCIEYSKQWPDLWKTSSEFEGINEILTPEFKSLCMFAEEKVVVTHHGPVDRTIIVITPDSIRSVGLRLIHYLNQDTVGQMHFKQICIRETLLNWLNKVKLSVGRLTYEKSILNFEAPLFADLMGFPLIISCATNNIDMAAMSFETLDIFSDINSTHQINNLLKKWIAGERVLKSIVRP